MCLPVPATEPRAPCTLHAAIIRQHRRPSQLPPRCPRLPAGAAEVTGLVEAEKAQAPAEAVADQARASDSIETNSGSVATGAENAREHMSNLSSAVASR